MKKLLKAALLAVVSMMISVTAVQATTYYNTGDLILGFTTGSGTDVFYDLGQTSSLTNGKTWNLSTLLSGRTLAGQYWGVIGSGPNVGANNSTNWITAGAGAVPNTLNQGSTYFNKVFNSIGSICAGTVPPTFATYPVYAGESGSDLESDANSWYNQVTANASGQVAFYNVDGNNDPTVLGATNAYFWRQLSDGVTQTLLGVFTLGTNSVLTYNTVVPGFTATPTTGAAPLPVVFSDASAGSGTITNWLWSFGDGHSITNTTSANVTNTYASAGSYTVTLIVTAAGISSTNQQTAYIMVTNAAVTAPVAGFTGGPTNGPAALQVVFTNTSTGSYTNSVWNFGDTHTASNTNSANVTNTYAAAGSYSVTLTVIGAGGTNALTKTNYIVVTNAPPVASFSGTPTNGLAPLQVVFTNNSTGSYTNSVWNFGDTHTATNTTGGNVTNTYATAGSYTVTLIVTGAGGANTNQQTAYIVATNAPVAPVAGFTGGPTNGFAPLQVVFTNTSTGSFTNSVWNFDDTHLATNTTGANVTNTYAAAGSYSVTLTVTGTGGASTNKQTSYIVALATPKLTTTLAGGKLVFNCTNNPAQVNGVKYRIWSSTNLTVPLTNWVVVWSNTFPNLYTNNAMTNARAYFRFSSP